MKKNAITCISSIALACIAVSGYAQSWKKQELATLPIVSENSACNGSADTAGISVDRRVLLTCQSGIWKKSATGGTGMSGVLAPLAGMSISCSASDPFSGRPVTGYAMVDSQGKPLVRIVWHTYDTGFVPGFYAENTVNGWHKSVQWSVGYPNLGLYLLQPDGTTKLACTANWPLT